jgi:hypothetical protein
MLLRKIFDGCQSKILHLSSLPSSFGRGLR